jgi:hypothetical protein
MVSFARERQKINCHSRQSQYHRTYLDVELIIFGLVYFTAWVILISVVVMFLAYHWMLQAARIYGQLLESRFDLYRSKLYQELRWLLPKNSAEERQQGKQLTAYLWRGSESDNPEFRNEYNE